MLVNLNEGCPYGYSKKPCKLCGVCDERVPKTTQQNFGEVDGNGHDRSEQVAQKEVRSSGGLVHATVIR